MVHMHGTDYSFYENQVPLRYALSGDVMVTNLCLAAVLRSGTSKEEIAQSPFVEQLLRKGYEVIYFTDVLDEYVMQVRGCGGLGWRLRVCRRCLNHLLLVCSEHNQIVHPWVVSPWCNVLLGTLGQLKTGDAWFIPPN
jgi:hypothetical protein